MSLFGTLMAIPKAAPAIKALGPKPKYTAFGNSEQYAADLAKWEAGVASAVDDAVAAQRPDSMINTGYTPGTGKRTAASAARPAPVAAPPVTSSISTSTASVQNDLYSGMPKSLSLSSTQQAGNEASDQAFNDLMAQMSKVAGSQLKGEIPADVEAQVRMRAAEKGLFYGLGSGSPANRALTARDLGLTSLQIQQQGQQAGQALAGLSESRRQFNIQAEQAYKSYLEDVRRGDLSATELAERSRQFNSQQRLAAIELSANVLDSYMKIAYSYSAIGKPTAGQRASAGMTSDSFESMLQSIRSIGGF